MKKHQKVHTRNERKGEEGLTRGDAITEQINCAAETSVRRRQHRKWFHLHYGSEWPPLENRSSKPRPIASEPKKNILSPLAKEEWVRPMS
jgi:hypothetical protein